MFGAFFLFLFCTLSCKGVEDVVNIKGIENPYSGKDFESVIRIISTTHEHVTSQRSLEDYINRGIEVLSISNYSPAVPVFPITGFSRDYVDCQLERESDGTIIYDKDKNGVVKTTIIDNTLYKVPKLKRVTKTVVGGFTDFTKPDGELTDLSAMPQLPNAEHTHYYWPKETGLTATNHVNFVGTLWADVCNGEDEISGLEDYNQENGYNLSSVGLRSLFPIWSITEMLDSVRNNLLFPGKVFGTINHPGYSGIEDRYIDAYMKYGRDVFKGMEIYNNSDTENVKKANIEIYDRALIRGHRLWCVAANDWGNLKPDQSNYPKNRGCCVAYIDNNYSILSVNKKAEAVLDSFINGCFTAAG